MSDNQVSLGATYRGVVQNRPDVTILHLVERIDALYTIVEQLVEYEADTRATTEFIQGQIICVTINDSAKFVRKFSDDGENDVAPRTVTQWSTKACKLGVVLLKLLRYTCFDVREGVANVLHEDLNKSSTRDMEGMTNRERTMLSLRARKGVPQY